MRQSGETETRCEQRAAEHQAKKEVQRDTEKKNRTMKEKEATNKTSRQETHNYKYERMKEAVTNQPKHREPNESPKFPIFTRTQTTQLL